MDGKADLAYELSIDLMPEFEPVDAATLSLSKPVYTPTAKEIDEAVADLAKQNRTYEPRTARP
jgi:trigger factor